MENLEVTLNLPNLKLNIPEDRINFHTLERIVFNLSRKIGQELLEELLQIIDDKLKKERKRGILSNHGKRLRYMTTLLGDITNKALLKIEQMIRNPYNQKEKDNLLKLYTYISRNRQGITNQIRLKDKGIERAGAIESNINKVIAARFKKRGMSWSKPGALALLKIKETILNGEWGTSGGRKVGNRTSR